MRKQVKNLRKNNKKARFNNRKQMNFPTISEAINIAGGPEKVAEKLGVTADQIAVWLADPETIPVPFVNGMVEILISVSDENLNYVRNGLETMKSEG